MKKDDPTPPAEETAKAEAPKTVKVEALQDHTGFGQSHKVGDVYEIDEAFADTVVVQGKAKRT